MTGREVLTKTRKKLSESLKRKGTGEQKNRCWNDERKKKWSLRLKVEYRTGKRQYKYKKREVTNETRKKLSIA